MRRLSGMALQTWLADAGRAWKRELVTKPTARRPGHLEDAKGQDGELCLPARPSLRSGWRCLRWNLAGPLR